MTEPKVNSLVLYKGQAGLVRAIIDRKLAVELADGQRISLRPKDVDVLHPGPLHDLKDLRPPPGDVVTPWELLQGMTTDLPELAEMIYDQFNPATAWGAWREVQDGILFSGRPDRIVVHPPELADELRSQRAAREKEAAAWDAYLARVRQRTYSPEDERFLNDVIDLALERIDHNRTLKALGRTQTPQAAHAFLLEIGRWGVTDNPYPARFGVTVLAADAPVPPLPDEPRRDLTHLAALAIDDEGSDDPDDAIGLEDGTLWVHVADPAAVIHPDSAADLEARERGANLYLPEGTVRMLPPGVTDRLALGLADVSPALSFAIRLDDEAAVLGVEIVPSFIRATRLSYEAAEEQLEQDPLLAGLAAIASRRRARREAAGAVEIELPEVKVKVTNGNVEIRPLPPLRSRDVVREAMLAAGEALGRFALEHQIPMLFTVQDAPYELDGPPPGGPAGAFAQRRVMQRGRQATAPAVHSGLGLPVYIQATSPLRRYLDLVAHQQVRAFLDGRVPLQTPALLERLSAADASAGPVRRTERFSVDHWRMVYLMGRPKWEGTGIVVDQRDRNDTILIPELALETTLPSRNRRLNDSVRLALTGVDLPALSARFRDLG
jgi:exoribonuclease-2